MFNARLKLHGGVILQYCAGTFHLKFLLEYHYESIFVIVVTTTGVLISP